MTRGQRAGKWARRALLLLGITALVAGMGWIAMPVLAGREAIGLLGVVGFNSDSRGVYLAVLFVYLGAFFGTQWLFLRPRKEWAMRQTLRGRPMRRSIFSAALIASLLSVGAVATFLEIPDWWRYVVASDWARAEELNAFSAEPIDGVKVQGSVTRMRDIDDVSFRTWPGLVAIAVAWGLWAFVFWRYWRAGDRYTQFTRMVRGLLIGSVLELFVATTVHAFTYRRDDCYCCRGSYTGLVFGGTALLWAFGPGIILLYKRERYRQRLLVPVCIECGYDLRGIQAARCPECGRAIPDEVLSRMMTRQ